MSQPHQTREMHIYDYLRVLYKWRKTVTLCFAVVVFLATTASFIATPVYKTSSRILIDREIPRVLDITQLIPVEATGTEFYQTHYKLLQSKSFVLRVIQSLDLAENRSLTPTGVS
jgi:uncharacterized protein involved in exopolysaccharide biosynthesis